MRNFITLALILVWTTASAHTHIWQKQSTQYGVDNYGNQVMICNWVCNYDYNNQHYATTQGQSFCPQPSI